MNLLLNIAITYLRNRKRQSILSILGVTIGVSFFIAITALLKGMQLYFIEKVIDVSPHVIIKDEFRIARTQSVFENYPDYLIYLKSVKPKDEIKGIRNYREILEYLETKPDLNYVGTLQGQAFLRYGGKEINATIIGMDPEKEKKVSKLARDIIEGSIDELKTTNNGIIIGIGLAKKLGLSYGNNISVISPVGNQIKMKIVGIFRTGITSLDSFETYTTLKKVQVLQNKIDKVNRIRIRLNDVEKAESLARDLENKFSYRAESWKESNRNIFSIFNIQNGIMYSTVFAILIVSSFGIYNIVSTIVNEKTRDIAILKSMGFSEGDVKIIFLLKGFIIGVVGMIAGCLLGYIFIELLSTIKFKVEDESFMSMEGFILYRHWSIYVFGGLVSVLSASLSALIPAGKAARLAPVKIIRGAA